MVVSVIALAAAIASPTDSKCPTANIRAFGSGTSVPHGERSAIPWSAPGMRT